MANYLLDSRPLIVLPELALIFNSENKAILLQQVHYWIENVKSSKPEVQKFHYKDGRFWTYNSYREWQLQIPWISEKTIERAFKDFESLGIIISDQLNKKYCDQRKWYTIDYETLDKYIQDNSQKVEEWKKAVAEASRQNVGMQNDAPGQNVEMEKQVVRQNVQVQKITPSQNDQMQDLAPGQNVETIPTKCQDDNDKMSCSYTYNSSNSFEEEERTRGNPIFDYILESTPNLTAEEREGLLDYFDNAIKQQDKQGKPIYHIFKFFDECLDNYLSQLNYKKGNADYFKEKNYRQKELNQERKERHNKFQNFTQEKPDFDSMMAELRKQRMKDFQE
jgi:hypothetical protein